MAMIGLCTVCKKKKGRRYFVYDYIFITTKTTYRYPILKLFDDLNKWLMKHKCHLSASQLILLRPDILEKFYKDIKLKNSTEEILQAFLEEHELCEECYESYIKHVPLL